MAQKTAEINLESIVCQSKDHVSTELEGETILMCIRQGHYYGMDQILSRVWELIAKPTTVSAVCNVLMEEYDVSREKCEEDVLAILNELMREDLLETEIERVE